VDLLAKQGSMVAVQGNIDFDHEGAGMAKFMKKAVTGEGLALMRCKGRANCFWLTRATRCTSSTSRVAASPSTAQHPGFSSRRSPGTSSGSKGAGMAAGGLFNTRLEGRGWVAITTDGDPVVLRTDAPTFVDTDAVVAWSSNLQTGLNRTMKAKAAIGLGSGEAVQLTFQGDGIVIVQPSEGRSIANA
jgi:uncharacterized protein (AIM24 family)